MAITADNLFLLMLLGVATVPYILLRHLFTVKQDPKEPPFLPQKIPFIGHIIGIIRHNTGYYANLTAKRPLPIYSLAMPGGKMYIVNSPELIMSVQRNSKTLQFAPFASQFLVRICGLSSEAVQILRTNIDLREGDWGLYQDSLKAIHAALAPGAGLDHMSRLMLESVSGSLEDLNTKGTRRRISLAQWLRHELTLATSDAVYGPQNPLQDREVEDAFWMFESQLTRLMINVIPSVIARRGYGARHICSQAFERYFRENGHNKGSSLTKARHGTSQKYGISIEDLSLLELGGVLAILVNTTPTAFWMIYYVFSNASILADLRRELTRILTSTEGPDGSIHRSLAVANVKEKCPLLSSIFQETLRQRSFGSSTRQVLEDTLLADRYLLKKGAIVQMPSLVVHADSTAWGPTVHDFDARRFIKSESKETGEQKYHPGAFRAFGGGTTLCPGRHFAATEIMALVAMLVMRFDVVPVGARWVMPPRNNDNLAAAITYPGGDIEVDVMAREGYQEGSWSLRLE